jgi:hypothetical protein
LLRSADPKIFIELPKAQDPEVAAKISAAAKDANSRKSTAKDGKWLSTKPKATKRKKATAKKTTSKRAKTTKKKTTKTAKPKAAAKKSVAKKASRSTGTAKTNLSTEVIELLSDDEEPDAKPPPLATKDRNIAPDDLWNDPSSESEFEFGE